MRAILLAAGRGVRLTGESDDHPPKSLLRFGGHSLLARHIRILRQLSVEAVTIVVGYRDGDIRAEINDIGASEFVEFIDNPRFHEGSLVSLWQARGRLTGGEDIFLMDADVLYGPDLIRPLLDTTAVDCLSYDREFESGDEPVKLCLAGGSAVEFRKIVDVEFDTVGEWPGFSRLSSSTAAELAAHLQTFVDRGDTNAPYEEAFRALLLAAAPGQFAFLDVTGTPWIEIDFPEDVVRAEREILPLLPDLGA